MSGGDDNRQEGELVRVDFGKRRSEGSVPTTPSTIGRVDDAEQAGATEDDDEVSVSPGDEEKLAVFTRMIDRGLVLVTLDARRPGVFVPQHLSGEPQLGLNFSHRFGIGDFDYDKRGVRASLSFSGRDVFCDVPWSAVWMMRSGVDGELAISPESVPPEIQAALAQASRELEQAEAEAPAEEQTAPINAAAALYEATESASAEAETVSAVPTGSGSGSGSGSGVDGDSGDGGEDDPEPPSRGGLRLVKG